MSVDVAELLTKAGRDWQSCLAAHSGYSLVKLLAGIARAYKQAVIHDPLPDNDAHAIVEGAKPRSVAKSLADASEWVHRV